MTQDVNDLILDDKIIKRFIKKIRKCEDDGCWEWTHGKIKTGYGVIRINNKNFGAHRISYLMHFGNFDNKLCVLHKCDNPSCVRPDHLYLGTQTDNMKDMDNKKRRKLNIMKGEQNGRSKLLVIDVINIKKMLSNKISQREIAKKYNVSQVAVSLIKRNKNWKYVAIKENINE